MDYIHLFLNTNDFEDEYWGEDYEEPWVSFTFSTPERLDSLFSSMDDKHTYERLIYEAYVKNGGFWLTDEQRAEAYEEYKRKRPETYKA